MRLRQTTSEADFAEGWWLDWGQDPAPGGQPARACPAPADIAAIRNARFPPGRMDGVTYSFQETTVTLASSPVRLGFCGDAAINCNACFGDGLLVAPSFAAGQPGDAAIRLGFSTPVAAVGSFVAGLWPPGGEDGEFRAKLWVRLTTGGDRRSPVWMPPFTVRGKGGQFVLPGTPRGAPFLGAISSEANIVEAAFDIAPIGGAVMPQVAIAPLFATTPA